MPRLMMGAAAAVIAVAALACCSGNTSGTVRLLSGGADADADLDCAPGQNTGSAEAGKQGNTYKITGTATSSKPSRHTTRSFEIDVTCP